MNMGLEESWTAKAGIGFCRRTMAVVGLMTCICLALSSGGVLAQKSNAPKAEVTLEAFDHKNFDRFFDWDELQPKMIV